jgi:hypothetical protein
MMSESVDPLLLQRPALNPYRIGAGMIWHQLKWDLQPEAWRSRGELRRWRDRYRGQKAVVLCNGPSLLKVDFEALSRRNVFCFGLNKINLLFARTDFRPSCVVAVNRFVIDQNSDFYNETALPLFLSRYGISKVRSRGNVAFLSPSGFPMFSRDCSVAVFEGYTVTFVALQLAFHMGFRDVTLVGADHDFATKGPANLTVVSGRQDESHFDPNYFAGGVKWQLPDLFQSEVAYTMARDMYAAHGRRVVNSTDGGKLEVFDRVGLQTFLDEGR